jgi:hypothetical protein
VPTVVPSSPGTALGAHHPPDLVLVVDTWPRLPAVIKAAILVLVQASDHSLCKPPDEIDV